jgi:eukaryotic-like serine/threonine-protein kinase
MPPDFPENPSTVDPLDAYLSAVHTGRKSDQDRLRLEHPELAADIKCLDALEKLAPPRDGPLSQMATLQHGGGTPAVTAPPIPGSDFGQYELIRELGRGGMGVVYLARQKDLDRLVALKMILSSFLASDEVIHRFHTEAKAAARLRHPHIVQVFETGQCHGQHYFAMDFIEGRGLETLLQSGPLAAEKAVRLLVPIARAVGHLHDNGVIHRDLKPSNILADQAGHPYLTDFGLAKMLEEQGGKTTTGMVIGTPSYMAPEQAAGGKRAGPLSDVYSLGAILYEMLTGRPPFHESTPLDTIVQVVEGEPTLPRQLNPAIPRDLEVICLKCLEKNPANRYVSAAALADDLERFLRGEAVEAKPHGWVQKLMRWGRRQPALASRLLSLCIFVAIVQANYHLSVDVRVPVHIAVLIILALWALGSWECQVLLARPRWAGSAPFLWAVLDTTLLSVMIYISDTHISPVLVIFPALIVAAGLWFRVRVVWFTTLLTAVAYSFLVVTKYTSEDWARNPHYPLIFLAALVVLGFMVAYQVQRVRVLSRYYEHRPLP